MHAQASSSLTGNTQCQELKLWKKTPWTLRHSCLQNSCIIPRHLQYYKVLSHGVLSIKHSQMALWWGVLQHIVPLRFGFWQVLIDQWSDTQQSFKWLFKCDADLCIDFNLAPAVWLIHQQFSESGHFKEVAVTFLESWTILMGYLFSLRILFHL